MFKIAEKLASKEYLDQKVFNRNFSVPMPSIKDLELFVSIVKEIIFPGYYRSISNHSEHSVEYMTKQLISAKLILDEQVLRGFCYNCHNLDKDKCDQCKKKSKGLVTKFFNSIPNIRKKMLTHVYAAIEGDPATESYSEIIYSYPSIVALLHHEIAHSLYKLSVPLVPRIISEFAHSKTGIDIHPGAQIDEYFFIDHGTGVVIGETCIIGKRVRLYQGVTLGAISIRKNKETGIVEKGELRHPILKDRVTIYSGATVLGRITIGNNVVIGGNMWVTKSIENDTKIC